MPPVRLDSCPKGIREPFAGQGRSGKIKSGLSAPRPMHDFRDRVTDGPRAGRPPLERQRRGLDQARAGGVRRLPRPPEHADLLRAPAGRRESLGARHRLRRGAQHAAARQARRAGDGYRHLRDLHRARPASRGRRAAGHRLPRRERRAASLRRRDLRLRDGLHELHGRAGDRSGARRGFPRPEAWRLSPVLDLPPVLRHPAPANPPVPRTRDLSAGGSHTGRFDLDSVSRSPA
jgi:hypothetical protein